MITVISLFHAHPKVTALSILTTFLVSKDVLPNVPAKWRMILAVVNAILCNWFRSRKYQDFAMPVWSLWCSLYELWSHWRWEASFRLLYAIALIAFTIAIIHKRTCVRLLLGLQVPLEASSWGFHSETEMRKFKWLWLEFHFFQIVCIFVNC